MVNIEWFGAPLFWETPICIWFLCVSCCIIVHLKMFGLYLIYQGFVSEQLQFWGLFLHIPLEFVYAGVDEAVYIKYTIYYLCIYRVWFQSHWIHFNPIHSCIHPSVSLTVFAWALFAYDFQCSLVFSFNSHSTSTWARNLACVHHFDCCLLSSEWLAASICFQCSAWFWFCHILQVMVFNDPAILILIHPVLRRHAPRWCAGCDGFASRNATRGSQSRRGPAVCCAAVWMGIVPQESPTVLRCFSHQCTTTSCALARSKRQVG